MPVTNTDSAIYLIIGMLAAFFLLLLVVGLASFFNNFSRELSYLNTEIRRTYGAERRYYIRRRRRLWLSLLPFIKYR